jgi:ureidoglycolate hydrolase
MARIRNVPIVAQLTVVAFQPFGQAVVEPPEDARPTIETGGIRFFEDLIVPKWRPGAPTVGPLRVNVHDRDEPVTKMERHNTAPELFIGQDCSYIIMVAPAVPPEELRAGLVQAFSVDLGEAIVLNPGVWHCTPWPEPEDGVSPMRICVMTRRKITKDCGFATFPHGWAVQPEW